MTAVVIAVCSLSASTAAEAAPGAPRKSERPQYTPSDITAGGFTHDINADSSLVTSAENDMEDKKWSNAIATWDRLLKRHPNCTAFTLSRAIALRSSGFVRPALHAMEKIVADMEKRNERYSNVYFALAETYLRVGDKKNCELIAVKMLDKFPERADVIRKVMYLNRALASTKLAAEGAARLKNLQAHPPKNDTTLSTMKVTSTARLPKGYAYEMLVTTECFPQFKFIMTEDRVVGDTGIVKYIIGPPNYDDVALVNEESKNYFRTTIKGLMADHCSRSIETPMVGSVVSVGTTKVFDQPCIQMKCTELGESSYVKMTLAKDIVVSRPLARAINLVLGTPLSDYVPLGAESVQMGYSSPKLKVSSLRKIKVTPSMMLLNPKFNRVKSKGELIYASDGALKDSDLDQYLQSK